MQHIAAFSQGFYKLTTSAAAVLTDLRMGQEPAYIFTFAIGNATARRCRWPSPRWPAARPAAARLPWLWRRLWGEPLPPPR